MRVTLPAESQAVADSATPTLPAHPKACTSLWQAMPGLGSALTVKGPGEPPSTAVTTPSCLESTSG